MKIIELSQCPPELLLISKNRSHGGESYDAIIKRNLSSRLQTVAKLESIDLENGAYLFFLNIPGKSSIPFTTRPRDTQPLENSFKNTTKFHIIFLYLIVL